MDEPFQHGGIPSSCKVGMPGLVQQLDFPEKRFSLRGGPDDPQKREALYGEFRLLAQEAEAFVSEGSSLPTSAVDDWLNRIRSWECLKSGKDPEGQPVRHLLTTSANHLKEVRVNELRVRNQKRADGVHLLDIDQLAALAAGFEALREKYFNTPYGGEDFSAIPQELIESESVQNGDTSSRLEVLAETNVDAGPTPASAPPPVLAPPAEVVEKLKPPPPPPGLISGSRYLRFTIRWNRARLLGHTYSWEQFDLELAQEKFLRDLERRVSNTKEEPAEPISKQWWSSPHTRSPSAAGSESRKRDPGQPNGGAVPEDKSNRAQFDMSHFGVSASLGENPFAETEARHAKWEEFSAANCKRVAHLISGLQELRVLPARLRKAV